MKKYRLTEETMIHRGIMLYRIQALKSFLDVKAGDKGGWVQSEDNLSQEDDCWVYQEAKIYGKAQVYEDAVVGGYAEVYGNALVYGAATIYENAKVCDHAHVAGEANVCGTTLLKDLAALIGDGVFRDVTLRGDAEICDETDIAIFPGLANSKPIVWTRDSHGEQRWYIDDDMAMLQSEFNHYQYEYTRQDIIESVIKGADIRYLGYIRQIDEKYAI